MTVDYDLQDNDLLFGLGLGCGGSVHLQLVRLDKAQRFEPLESLFAALQAGEHCELALVCATTDPALPPGSMALAAGGGTGIGMAQLLNRLGKGEPGPGRARYESLETATGSAELLIITITPSPHVLVCGAGPDAVPLVSQVLALGWDCTVADHREAFADPARFPPAQTYCVNVLRLLRATRFWRKLMLRYS